MLKKLERRAERKWVTWRVGISGQWCQNPRAGRDSTRLQLPLGGRTPSSDGVRSRPVAKDFKGGDKDRDDMFAATPPLESKRLLISRAATRVNGK